MTLPPPRPEDIFVHPGECFVGDARMCLRTLLGSCVTITLWHPARRVGAMSHFLLARRSRAAPALDGRFAEEAFELMRRGLLAYGVQAAECEANVFGGGNMFPGGRGPLPNIGAHNGSAARQLLHRHGIVVKHEHLFGIGHRHVVFEIASGAVWVRQIAPKPPDRLRVTLPFAETNE